MKRPIVFILLVTLILIAAAYTAEKSDHAARTPVMYIEPAHLSNDENAMAELLGFDLKNRIFDYRMDERVRSMRMNTYELIDGQWSLISGGGGQALTDKAGRIAIDFDRIPEGMRVAVQTPGGTQATTHESPAEFNDLSCATAILSERTGAVYDTEIPLVIQILTQRAEVSLYGMEYFHQPEIFAGDNHDHVYAVTVTFSEKPLEQLMD